MTPESRPASPADPVEDYLDQLFAGLRTTPRQARRIIAEAEDHLREATAAGIEAGLTEREAQEAAISSFGSVRAVVRAHARRVPPLAVFGELAMGAWKLTSIAVLAVAGSGLVAFVMNQVLGPRFVGGSPAAASKIPLGACTYWMNIWTQPIANRVDMLSTGVRTQIGVKVFGPTRKSLPDAIQDVQHVSEEIAQRLRTVPGAVGGGLDHLLHGLLRQA